MMQEMIVGLIVAYAAWAVAKRYAPKALRARVRAAAAFIARQAGFVALAERIESASTATASCSDGCGSCGGCEPNTSAKTSPDAVRHGVSVEQLRRTIPR